MMCIICGSLIKQMREGQGLGLEYVEMVSGVFASKLSKIENGNQLLDAVTLCELSIIYDIDPGAFMAIVSRQYIQHYTPPSNKKAAPIIGLLNNK